MEASSQQVIALHRDTGCSIGQCRQAFDEAHGNHDLAAEILRAWSVGRPSPNGSMPAGWKMADFPDLSLARFQRHCPKCHHEFRAVPDVVRCPKCRYEFREGSGETPNYFSGFGREAPATISDWFGGGQLGAVRQIIQQMANRATPEEQETLLLLSQQLDSIVPLVDLHRLLTTLSSPKLRIIGELLVAMSGGYDTIKGWLATWNDVYR
jgi:hypothetical protein